MASVELGLLWMRSYKPGRGPGPYLELRCLLGDTPPRVVDGYAKFTTIERKRDRAITEWQGTNPLKVEISLIIDYHTDPLPLAGVRCEGDCRTLERMAGLDAPGDVEPVPLLWNANGPHDEEEASHLRWYVTALTWGDSIWASSGRRLRQAAVIELTQQVEDEFIKNGAAKQRAKSTKKKKGAARKKSYRVKKGDTLKKIAARELGSAAQWTVIAALQNPPLRDPSKVLTTGHVLRMP